MMWSVWVVRTHNLPITREEFYQEPPQPLQMYTVNIYFQNAQTSCVLIGEIQMEDSMSLAQRVSVKN
jgi:hypothetical protein